MTNTFLTTKEAADFLRCSVSALAKSRCTGMGAPFIKNGGQVLYSREAIVAYLEDKAHASTSEYETKPGPGRPAKT